MTVPPSTLVKSYSDRLMDGLIQFRLSKDNE